MGSTRLPGKVMLDLCGMPVLWHVWRRVMQTNGVNKVVVATSTLPGDDVIQANCLAWGIDCYRGSESDVLSRYAGAANQYNASIVIRITADCPLIDPDLISRQLECFISKSPDYLSNVVEPRTYPKGFDTEIFTMAALARAHLEATTAYDREHVTPYIRNNTKTFRVEPFYGKDDLSMLNFCLDTPEDYDFIKQVYTELYRSFPEFDTNRIYGSIAVQNKFPKAIEKLGTL